MSAPDNIPDRFMAWTDPVLPLTHTGTWATTRYPEEAVEFLRATPARLHADELAEALRAAIPTLEACAGGGSERAKKALRAALANLAKLEKEEGK